MNEIVFALVLFVVNPAVDAKSNGGVEPRSHWELGVYASKTECTINAQSIRVDVKAARLRCVPRELSPDEKRVIAIAEGRWP